MKKLAVFCLFTLPVDAETILSPAEFEAFATGKTVYFSRAGQPYGAEQYLRNRKVIWAFTDGQCAFGEWFPQGDQLCFLYDNRAEAVCWHYVQTDAGKAVRVVGDDPANDLLVAGHDEEHLECAAPNIGVKYTP